ncbi:hypothetical protein Sjap_007665 [Stephania japonica]|uniref:Uncharacterized protein n=1 Tax=Stephania japonica TaxID=461633 RepID=A0AAP0JNY9_9MAGN
MEKIGGEQIFQMCQSSRPSIYSSEIPPSPKKFRGKVLGVGAPTTLVIGVVALLVFGLKGLAKGRRGRKTIVHGYSQGGAIRRQEGELGIAESHEEVDQSVVNYLQLVATVFISSNLGPRGSATRIVHHHIYSIRIAKQLKLGFNYLYSCNVNENHIILI